MKKKNSLPKSSYFAKLLAAGITTATLTLIASQRAEATTYTWDGGGADNNWSTAINWGGTAPVAATDADLVFAGTTRLTPTNDFTAASNFGGITFDVGAGAFTLSGNSITLNGNITNNSSNLQTISLAQVLAAGAHVVTTNASGNLAIGGIISGAGSLTKSGAGTLTLSATNTFSGGLTIASGILAVTANTQLGGTGGTAGAITLDGGTLKMSFASTGQTNTHVITVGAGGGTINVGSTSGTPTYILGNAGNLVGSGNLTITGNGTLTQAGSAGASVFVMGNANTGYSGNVSVSNGGIIEYANATAIPTTSTFTVDNLGMLSANSVTIAQAITVNSGGFLAFQNNGSGVFSGPITLNGSTTVRLQNWWSSGVQNGTISGAIGGTGSLTVNSGSGTGAVLTLSNTASDYAGATTISGAVVSVAALANVNTASSIGKGSAGGSSADLVLNNGTLRYTGSAAQSTDRLFSVGTSGGTIDASGSNNANPLAFTGTGAMGFNSQTGARTLTLTGSNTGSNSLALGIGDNSGATSVTKTGAGTWALGGTNTYSGATTLTTGTLSFLNTAAKSASTTVTAAAGTTVGLGVGGSGFYSAADVSSLIANTLTGFSLNATTSAGIDTTAGDFTFDTTSLSGTRTISKIGANTLIFSGTNTYAGTTQVQNGTLEYQTTAGMSSSSALTLAGGTLSLRADADTTFTPASITGSAGSFTIAVNQLTGAGAGKTLTLANTYNTGGSGSNLTVSSTSGDTLLLSSQLAFGVASAGSATINLSGADMTLNAGVNYNGVTNGPLLIVNANSNTLIINGTWTTGTNRWSGIQLNNGTLTLANGQAGGSSTNNGVYAVLNGGTLNLNNANAIGGAAAGNNFTINGGTLDNTSGSAKTLAKNPAMTVNGDFAFSTVGGTSANNLNLGTNTVSLGTAAGTTRTITTNGAATLTLGGVISNGTTANSITKAGTGTLALGGANTFSGGVAINAGTLNVTNAAALGTGALAISGGTLSLNGTGVQSVTGISNLTLNSGTISLTLTSAASFDQITGNGSFTLLGGTIDLTNSVTDYASTYQIFNFTSGGSVSGLSFSNYDAAGFSANLSNTGVLSFTAVPEPSQISLAIVGLLGVMIFVRRRLRDCA